MIVYFLLYIITMLDISIPIFNHIIKHKIYLAKHLHILSGQVGVMNIYYFKFLFYSTSIKIFISICMGKSLQLALILSALIVNSFSVDMSSILCVK